jgi:hypothetical protein
MSELSRKRVRTSLKAIAQFKRACILRSSLSERCTPVKFLGGSIQYSKKNCGLETGQKFYKSQRPNLTKMPVKLTKIIRGTRYCLMKTEGGQSIHFDNCLVGKCPLPAQKGQHHESNIKRSNHLLVKKNPAKRVPVCTFKILCS